jgi:flagellar basal-body rod protein FlgF
LITGNGLPVLGNNGPIAIPPANKMEIGTDGTITILPQGGQANAPVVVDRIRLVNPDLTRLEKGTDGLLRLQDGQPATPDASVGLVIGALEGSNVSTVEEMVQMIELQRQYEYQTDGNASAQIMRMS